MGATVLKKKVSINLIRNNRPALVAIKHRSKKKKKKKAISSLPLALTFKQLTYIFILFYLFFYDCICCWSSIIPQNLRSCWWSVSQHCWTLLIALWVSGTMNIYVYALNVYFVRLAVEPDWLCVFCTNLVNKDDSDCSLVIRGSNSIMDKPFVCCNLFEIRTVTSV